MSDEKSRVRWLLGELGSVRRGGDGSVDGVSVSITVDGTHPDDCAVLEVEGRADIVIGTDYVRGPKFLLFERGHLTLSDIGRYCVTANTSDLAAMGAQPIGFFAVVRYPTEMTDEEFSEVMSGIDSGCSTYGMRLLGGDTGSAERLILAGTALGICEVGTALRRDAARPGDVVAVTGQLGGAGAALAAVAANIEDQLGAVTLESVVQCWRETSAQPLAGRAIHSVSRRVAGQDVSDGLRATLRELGEASGVSIMLVLHLTFAYASHAVGQNMTR